MDHRDAAATDCRTRPDGSPGRRRRWRLLPPAVTPIESRDLAAGLRGQVRGEGRDQFRRDVESMLGAESSGTYTSFRRTLAGCFHELARRDDRDRREVLIPAFCSSDFPDAIEGVGLAPVCYDVDPESLAVDMESFAAGLRSDPLAAVSVNVLGYGSPMDELVARCADRDTRLVEALGYALGAEYAGRPLGTYGDCAVLNFQQGKPVPIGGGMVVSHDPALSFGDDDRPAVGANVGALAGYAALSRPHPYYGYSRVRSLLDDPRVAAALDGVGLSIGRATTHPGSKFGVEYAPPFATISEFQGAVGCRVLDRLDDNRRQRARAAGFYADALSACPRVGRVTPIDGLSAHQHVRFPLTAATESLRDRLRTALLEAGIQATTLYDWPAIDPDAFPGAARLQRRVLTLPTHPYVDDRDRRLIVDTVRGVVGDD